MENLVLYEKHRKPPQEALKEIKGGRMSGKTDINPMWRIKALTEMFGPVGIGWYYKSTNKWLERSGDEISAFVDIELYVFANDKWSMPISGTGGSMFVAKEKGGLFVSDECYKMATTDAISVACKQLGIGADIYWNSDKSKYDKKDNGKDTKSNPNPLSAKEIRTITDLVNEYAELSRVETSKVFDILKTKFNYQDISSLTKEKGERIKLQLEVWIKGTKAKNGGE